MLKSFYSILQDFTLIEVGFYSIVYNFPSTFPGNKKYAAVKELWIQRTVSHNCKRYMEIFVEHPSVNSM